MRYNLTLLDVLEGHTQRVWHASWSPDGQRIATCSEDRSLRVWSRDPASQSFQCVATLDEGQARTLRCCEWSPDGNMLASASFDGTVIVWQRVDKNFGHWDQLTPLEGHDNEVKSVSWSYDGQYLATCGRDKKIWVWELLPNNDFECAGVLDGHTQDVKFIQWHPKLPILFSCSYDDTIKVWAEDGGDWWCAQTLVGHGGTVWGVALDRIGATVVSCSDDRSVKLWACESTVDPKKSWHRLCTVPELHKFPVYSVDWNVEHNVIATGGGDNSICILQCERSEDGSSVLTLDHRCEHAHDGDVNCVRWNPVFREGYTRLLLSAGDDEKVKVWQLEGC